MADLVKQFLAEKKPLVQGNTYLSHKLWIPKFEAWREASKFDYNNNKLLRTFGMSLVNRGLKVSSSYTAINCIRAYLTWLREAGTEVTQQVRPNLPRIPRETLFAPSEEQISIILGQVHSIIPEPYSTAICILPLTGMRDSELISLKLEDGDFLEDGKVVFNLQKTKTHRPRQVIMLKAGTPILKEYIRNVRPRLGSPSRWLFPKPKSIEHIDRKAVERHIRDLREKLGITNLTAHSFRRFFVTYLVGAGVKESVIAKLVGHTDLHMFDRYFSPNTELLSESLELAGERLERTT